MTTTHRVRVYQGSCSAVRTGTAALVHPLADVTRSEEYKTSDPESARVGVATTNLGAALSALLASRHVVAAFDDHEVCVACGPVAGPVDQQGNMFFGLKEIAESGYGGVAWFLDQDDQSVLATILLAEGLRNSTTGTAEPYSRATPVYSPPTSSRAPGQEPRQLPDEAPMYCTFCGTQIPTTAAFCPGCSRRHQTAEMSTSQVTPDQRPLRWTRLTDAVGTAGGIILTVLGFIISMEVGSAVAFWTWRTFGPLSVIVTFEFWAIVPFWYAWRWLIGHLIGWGWPA